MDRGRHWPFPIDPIKDWNFQEGWEYFYEEPKGDYLWYTIVLRTTAETILVQITVKPV